MVSLKARGYLPPKLSFSALSRVVLCVGALACSLSSTEAVIVVDGTTTEYRDNQNGYDAYYFLYDINKSSADFEATAFLTTDASGNAIDITAYNDGKTTANSDNPDASIHTSLTLAQAGKLTYDDGGGEDDYVAFYLSANQQGNSTSNFYGLDGLEIYTSDSATVDSIGEARSGVLAYQFDSTRDDTGGGTGQLELFYGNGNSNWDIVLYVPLDSFTLINNDYQQTYVHFIVDTYTDTAGSDSWIYDSNNDSLVPEPSSALLIALGGLVSLFKRRR
ncbi:MAG: PEP-CTERM sorting domain-containing protein [Akkermansiaceae bacterium]|nr:PEP-CTERM sorting domain-containing protein [Akkermansiaceae bacterium]